MKPLHASRRERLESLDGGGRQHNIPREVSPHRVDLAVIEITDAGELL